MKALTTLLSTRVFLLALGVAIAYFVNGTIVMTPKIFAEEKHSKVGPILHIQDSVYDFGTAVEGEDVIHDFLVQNTGSSTLELEKVKTT
jgi:hypothetical protein